MAAYCPLPEEGGGTTACGDVVVLRGGQKALENGLAILPPPLPERMPACPRRSRLCVGYSQRIHPNGFYFLPDLQLVSQNF